VAFGGEAGEDMRRFYRVPDGRPVTAGLVLIEINATRDC
jgi:hypothetical protein